MPVHAGDPLHAPQASVGADDGGHGAAEVDVLGAQFAGGPFAGGHAAAEVGALGGQEGAAGA